MKKETLYDQLVKSFREDGLTIEENSWTEFVGYKKPTKEYWFDVVVDNFPKRYTTHYWFKGDKNKLLEVEFYECDLKIEEENFKKLA